MMNTTALKRCTLIGILTVFILSMTTSFALAGGDGPEPGPPDAEVPYTFVPPPFIGQNMVLWLGEDPGYPEGIALFMSGVASQVGNSDCTLAFNGVLVSGYEDLLSGGFVGVSCADLKPRDFMGNSTQFFSDGVELNCDDISPEYGWYIDIMGVGNIVCVDDTTGAATAGTARIIFMLSKPK
jgi:hypothetical protein